MPDDTSGRPMFAPWLRTDPAHALSERLGVPVHIENDANLGALGEAHFGAGRDHSESIYIKIADRSIGAGLVLACDIAGRLIRFPYEIPIGTMMGVVGSVIFLYLLLRRGSRLA